MADPTKAWDKAFTSGSKVMQDRLKRVHAKNPAFQSWLKSSGHGAGESVKQASKEIKQTVRAKQLAAKSATAYGATKGLAVGGEHGGAGVAQKADKGRVWSPDEVAALNKQRGTEPVQLTPAQKRMAAIKAAAEKSVAKKAKSFDVPTLQRQHDDLRDVHDSLHSKVTRSSMDEEVELDEMDKSQPSSSRGAEGLALGKKANPVKPDKVKSGALKILQKQYKKVKEEVELEEGKYASTIAAIAAQAYEPKVGDKVRTRKGGQIPGKVEKIEGNKVFFRHPEGKLYATHSSNLMREEAESVNEDQAADWQKVQSMEKGSMIGGKDAMKMHLKYLNAVHAHQKKHGLDTAKTKKKIEGINRTLVQMGEEVEQIDEAGALMRKLVPGLGRIQAASKAEKQRDLAKSFAREVPPKERGDTNPSDGYHHPNTSANRHWKRHWQFQKIATKQKPFQPLQQKEEVELEEGKIAKALAVGAMSLASMGAKAHTDTTKSVAQLAAERPVLAQRLKDIGATGQVPASDKRAAELQRKQDQEMPASERRAKELKKEEAEQIEEVTKKEAEAALGGPVKEKPTMPPGKQPAGHRYVRNLARRAMKKGMKEEVEQVVEQDDTMEKVEMAQTQLHFICYAANEILEFVKMGGEVEEWYQNKLSKVHSDMESLHSYIEGEKRRTGMVKEEEEQIDEKINLVKAKMGDVVKDFYKSKAPQFKGKSMEKRRQMAIAAKLGAEREAGMREEVEQIDEKYTGKVNGTEFSYHASENQLENDDKLHKAIARQNLHLEDDEVKAIVHSGGYSKHVVVGGKKHRVEHDDNAFNEEIVTETEGKVAVTPKEKALAAHHGDPKRITYGDVIKARLKSAAAKKMGK